MAESTGNVEKIKTADITLDAPPRGGSLVVLQRHGKYIRDIHDERVGSLMPSARTEAINQSAHQVGRMFSQLAPEDREHVDFLIVASDTRSMDGGQRSMETAEAIEQGIEKVLAENNVSVDHILNKKGKFHGEGGPRPTTKLQEPNMFTEAPEFVEFMKGKYGDDFWVAFEDDREAERRKEAGAESPADMGERLSKFVNVLSRFARVYHHRNKNKRLVIWALSHYDTISPYVKQDILHQAGYLPVEYAGGIAINIDPNGEATTKIDNKSYTVPLKS